MNIRKYEILSTEDTIERLRKTPLKGPKDFDGPKVLIYENATIELWKDTNIDLLVPPQNYVLIPKVQDMLDIADAFGIST